MKRAYGSGTAALAVLLAGCLVPLGLPHPSRATEAPDGSTGAQPAGEGAENAPQYVQIDGVTFADAPGTLYAPLRELGEALGLAVDWKAQTQQATLEGEEVSGEDLRELLDGTQLLPVRALRNWEAQVSWDQKAEAARVSQVDRQVEVRRGEKQVAVSLDEQELRAWQGTRLILKTRISSGKAGNETPTGSFTAGPLKRRMLISRKYNDAKMPWSVQVRGDVVIHGYPTVPPRAASHGCIRMPLTGKNPARWFYFWIDEGTPIHITDGWAANLPES